MIEVRPASNIDMQVLHGDDGKRVTEGHIAVHEGRVVASGGFLRIDGVLWAFLNITEEIGGLAILLAVRRGLKNATEMVYAPCDERQEQSKRLLKILGFKPTNQKRHGMVIWLK